MRRRGVESRPLSLSLSLSLLASPLSVNSELTPATDGTRGEAEGEERAEVEVASGSHEGEPCKI